MTVESGQKQPGSARRREWTRTAASIGIACLLFNALVISGHSVRMAANAAGLGGQTILCTAYGPVTVATASLDDRTQNPNPVPGGTPGSPCPFCAFAHGTDHLLASDAQDFSRIALAARLVLQAPAILAAAAKAETSGIRPRAPPVPV